jgi:alpha-galactosidase
LQAIGANRLLQHAHAEVLLSDGRLLSTVRDDALSWQITLRGADALQLVLRLRNTSGEPLRVEQLRPLVWPRGWRDLPLDALRIAQTGWQSWSLSHPPARFESNLTSANPPIRGPVLPHRSADSQIVPWMTIVTAADGPALLLGFVAAGRQQGTIEVVPAPGGGHVLRAATELEGCSLAPGDELLSEPLLIAVNPSEAALRDLYAEAVAGTMTAPPHREVLTGWCSWYQLFTDVSERDVRRNLAHLANFRDLLPLDVVQIDDGYEREVGDWLDWKETFGGGLAELAAAIRGAGYLPGLWLAPFLVSARSRTFAEHPDWVVRDSASGEPLTAIRNWGAANHALDTTHPEALAWLEQVMSVVCNEWGFEYLKLDFLYAAALRGARHEAAATSVEAYRRGLQLIRRVAGGRFLLGCGAPLLPSVGLVDGMRIGSDVAPFWGRPDAESPDGPSTANALRATLARSWLQGRWWVNDPDCVLVRDESQLSLAEVQAWASIVALSGGMVFVGDDVSRVAPDRLALLSRLLPASGEAAEAFGPLFERVPQRLQLQVRRPWDEWSIVALANWRDDEAAPLVFDPAEWQLPVGPYHLFDLWDGTYHGKHRGPASLGALDPHSLRLLSVHRDLERPQIVGSTGHLLGEAMDVADARWDGRQLVVTPSPRGPVARRGEIAVAGPGGRHWRLPFATVDPTPITLT